MNRPNKDPMDPVRVMVVDDSRFVRTMIRAILESDLQVTVVGEAENGAQAVERIAALKPDIVTMDIQMPVMNGQEAISQLMAFHPVPILVVTDVGDAAAAYAAISRGALEVMGKSEIDPDHPTPFIDKIRLLSRVKVISHLRGKRINRHCSPTTSQAIQAERPNRVIAIASSTGGPKALATIIVGLPPEFPHPILVAQHIHPDFVPPLVQWLNGLTQLPVVVARGDGAAVPGTIHIAPADQHLELRANGTLSLHPIGKKEIYHPSCDRLLSSVADAFGADAVGVILTGMGDDGVIGISRIRDAGGTTIAQDEETSIVFGMPKQAIDRGCIDTVMPLGKISGLLIDLAVNNRKKL